MLLNSKEELWCDKCNLKFSNYFHYKSHCDGALHAENLHRQPQFSTSPLQSQIKSSNTLTYSKEDEFVNKYYRQVHQTSSSLPTFISNMTTSSQHSSYTNSSSDAPRSNFLFSNPPQDLTLDQMDMIFRNGNLYQNLSQASDPHQHSSPSNASFSGYQTIPQSNKINFSEDRNSKHVNMSQNSYTLSHNLASDFCARDHALNTAPSSDFESQLHKDRHHNALFEKSFSKEKHLGSLPTLSEIFNVFKQNDVTKRKELENKLDRFESIISDSTKTKSYSESRDQNEPRLSDQSSKKPTSVKPDTTNKQKYSFKVKESTNKQKVLNLTPLDEREESRKSLLGKYKPTNASNQKAPFDKNDQNYKMRSDDRGNQAKSIFDLMKKESQYQNVDRNARNRFERPSIHDSRRSAQRGSLRDNDFRIKFSVLEECRKKIVSTSDKDDRVMYSKDRRSSTQTSSRIGREINKDIRPLMDLHPGMTRQILSKRLSSNSKANSSSLKNVDSRAFSHSSRNDKLQSASSKPHHTAVPIDINDMHPSKTSSFLHQQQPKKDHDYRSSPPHKKMFIDHHSGNHDHTDNNKSASKYMDYETRLTVTLFRETLMKLMKESLVLKELNKEDVYLLNNLSLSELRLLRGVQGLVDISSTRKILDIVRVIRTLDPTVSQMLVNEGKVLQKDGKCLMPQKALSPRDVGPPLLCHLILLIRLHDRDVESGKNRS